MLPDGNLVVSTVSFGCLALAVWAFVDAALRKTGAFPAVERQTKVFWLVILGLAAAVLFFFGIFSFFGVGAVVASLVYLLDVRPKVRAVTRGPRW